jgi:hypothetical protein
MKASQFSDAQKAFILKQDNDAFRLPRSAEGVRRCFKTGAQPRVPNCDGPKRSPAIGRSPQRAFLLARGQIQTLCWRYCGMVAAHAEGISSQ